MDDTHRKSTGSAAVADLARPVLTALFDRLARWMRVIAGGPDWSARRPVLTRATAHLSVLAVAALVVFLSGAVGSGLLARVTGAGDEESEPSAGPAADGQLASAAGGPAELAPGGTEGDSLVRAAVPHTTFPERPRKEVISYEVVAGDTVWGIANMFDITPHTIFWANSDTLNDNPHMLPIGLLLYVPPVSGVYHTVESGETVATIAEAYSVEPDVIYNEWNHIEVGDSLQVGESLVIPGGSRRFIVWEPDWYVRPGSGACRPPQIAEQGYGYFEWPTDGRRISGWRFHDPRNPPHSGLDIGLRTGDPIYAADGGWVAYRGVSGGYGNLLVINHGTGYMTFYAHLSEFYVECGETVNQRQVVAAGGNTGYSTGPHLHFEIRFDNVPVDPESLLPLS
jgi:LysM repeat protein